MDSQFLTIPLFPLNIVLMPGILFPLHIFEERYKKMVNESLETGEEFGIILSKKDGQNESIGTFAKVQFLLKTHKNGEMDIVVIGSKKFELQASYYKENLLMGDVEIISDNNFTDEFTITETLGHYNRIQKYFHFGIETDLSMFQDLNPLSYFLSTKIGMPNKMQQRLLEIHSEKERLEFISQYCLDILPKITNESELYLKMIRN
ncbi:MAG: hypothetical protein DWQ06_12420 [Calditrichaeota bacterium]|nr:MAG: hypothetical protein DWQ06_12420 [Calditrichota bacterium]